MPVQDSEPTYSQREVQTMLVNRLPPGKYTWIRDPEGNPTVQAYGERCLPAQPVYVSYRPSVVKMQLRFTPRRISPSREEELWRAAEAARVPLRSAGSTARRQMGRTQETERDEQWVVNIPERLGETGFAALEAFVALAAACMGIETPEDESG